MTAVTFGSVCSKDRGAGASKRTMRALLPLAAVSFTLMAAAPAADQMSDYGATLRDADAARASGDYQAAADALRAYVARWQDGALAPHEAGAVLERARRYVELGELLERAGADNAAAAAYLAAVARHAEPSARAVEQVRALAILARYSPRVRELLGAAFPARVVVRVDTPPDFPREHHEVLLENALADLTRDQPLRLLDEGAEGGVGTLTVVVTVRENDRRNSLLEGTAMKSWAVHARTELADRSGGRLSTAAVTTAMLGINPGNAAVAGMSKVADRVYGAVIDELVRHVDAP